MDLKVTIDGTDRTSLIDFKSANLKFNKTSQVDAFSFKYLKYGSRTWTPQRGDEVIVEDTDIYDSINENLVGYWKFDEGSGTDALDEINGNDGTITNGTYVDGKIGTGLDFDGVSGNVLVPDASEIQNIFDGGGEISGFINPRSDGENNVGNIVRKGTPGSTGYTIFNYGEGAGFVYLRFTQQFSGTDGSWRTERIIPLNSPTHFRIKYNADSVTNVPEFFINGESVAVTAMLTPTGTRATDVGDDLYFGNSSVDNGTFDGLIDEIRFYNAYKTVAEGKILSDSSWILLGGTILQTDMDLDVAGDVEFKVKCADYITQFDDELVVGTYEAQTIQEIIDDIKPTGYSSANVSGTYSVDKIQFNYQRKTDCIRDLADLVGYDWYIDPTKDIHFFAKSEKSAPFDITDLSENVIGGSLSVDKDNSGLKNVVYVRGGEYVGTARTENYEADGEQEIFPLGNKFSSEPTVEVNAVPQTVGVDNLNDFTSYDCLWSFQEKYIRFENPLIAADVVEISGTPLIPLIVKTEDLVSIAAYGRKEFKIEDKNIIDRDTAQERATAELVAYGDGLSEGAFMSYTDGLKPGQTIAINSTLLGVNESFLIQSVSMKMHTQTKAVYSIKLVSKKTMGIIEFLQMLLREGDKRYERNADEVLTIIHNIIEAVQVVESIRQDPWTVNWVFGPYHPTGPSDNNRRPIYNRGAVYL